MDVGDKIVDKTDFVTKIVTKRSVGICLDANKAKIWAKLIEEDFYSEEKIPAENGFKCENDSFIPEMDINKYYKLNGNHKYDKTECVKFALNFRSKFFIKIGIKIFGRNFGLKFSVEISDLNF